ncbi:hypothetical protein CN688_12060, partial [Bacillus toyonensis]
MSKGTLLTLPTGEGAPQEIEGVGSSINGGKGKSSPCRFGQSPRLLPCLAWIGGAEKRRRPLSILMRKRQNKYRVTLI